MSAHNRRRVLPIKKKHGKKKEEEKNYDLYDVRRRDNPQGKD